MAKSQMWDLGEFAKIHNCFVKYVPFSENKTFLFLLQSHLGVISKVIKFHTIVYG